jgi:hypothetical protein
MQKDNHLKLIAKMEKVQWKMERCHQYFLNCGTEQEKLFWSQKIQELHSELVKLTEEFEVQESKRIAKIREVEY